MEIYLLIACALIPIFGIVGFITGYNINAQQKIFKLPKASKPAEKSADEILLERIDNATVYKSEVNN